MKFKLEKASDFYYKKRVNLNPKIVRRLYQILETHPAKNHNHCLVINLDRKTITVYDDYIE